MPHLASHGGKSSTFHWSANAIATAARGASSSYSRETRSRKIQQTSCCCRRLLNNDIIFSTTKKDASFLFRPQRQLYYDRMLSTLLCQSTFTASFNNNNNNLLTNYDYFHTSNEQQEVLPMQQKIVNECPTISPLIRLQRAILRYPSCITSTCHDDKRLPSSPALTTYDDDENGDTRNLHSHKQLKQEQQHHNQSYWENTDIKQKQLQFNLDIWPNLECTRSSSSSISNSSFESVHGAGHVILGRNGSGKTLLSRSIIAQSLVLPRNNVDYDNATTTTNINNPYLCSGVISLHRQNTKDDADDNIYKHHDPNTDRCRRHHHYPFLSHVSFESHSQLLLNKNTTTVHRALIPQGGNRLSRTAQFLSVRLGMFPLLHRRIDTLSTGEIRRVLLVRALVTKPELLILDNAFDGLDVRGRMGLQDIVERVLKGFRMDILVQGVGNAREDTVRTQVLLMTHRPEEISEGIRRVTFLRDENKNFEDRMITEDRRGRSGEELVQSLLVPSSSSKHVDAASCGEMDHSLPNTTDVMSFWDEGRSNSSSVTATPRTLHKDIQVQLQNLTVTRDDTTILSHLNWTVKRGERWHLAGTNGAGKSTLSRLILHASMKNDNECYSGILLGNATVSDGKLSVVPSVTSRSTRVFRGGISWVSTELHLHALHNWGDLHIRDILWKGASFMFHTDGIQKRHTDRDDFSTECPSNRVEIEISASTVASWLGLLENDQARNCNDPFLSRPFSTLSQGEQKLLLIVSAIAQRPSLLVLDEPCQGLDLWNRKRLLGLIEKLCHDTDMSLLYITHHEEELIPSISHRLCLDDGKVTYCGVR